MVLPANTLVAMILFSTPSSSLASLVDRQAMSVLVLCMTTIGTIVIVLTKLYACASMGILKQTMMILVSLCLGYMRVCENSVAACPTFRLVHACRLEA